MDSAKIRELLYGLACPLCGGTRGDTLLIVIDAPNAGGGTVRVQCVRCHLFWSFGLEQTAATELAQERQAEPERPPISVDEVIELHLLLRDHAGPFTDLFAEAS